MKFLFSVVFSIILLFSLNAQENNDYHPKIAYVFSGGGARGLAHIGALKVLEEAGLQPDIITGTSMGSIVGGLYAVGYTADELSVINKNMNWAEFLSDDVTLQNVALEEKFEYRRYFLELPVRHKKISLPTGLLEGQNLSVMLSELTWRTAGTESFDDFYIPFRCVGTEIIKGEIIVFDSGDLATAMRASMAIPSVFSPVVPDSNTVIVDGGVIRNFPVQEARDLGAEIIIGIYTGFEEDITSKDLGSLSSVLMRSAAAYGICDSRLQSEMVDILIVPDLNKYSAADFDKGIEIENLGKEAAMQYFDKLKNLAGSLNLDSVNRCHGIPEENNKLLINDIEIHGLEINDPGLILGKLEFKIGDYITKEQLNEAIQRLFGTLRFEKLTYRFEKLGDGFKLILEAKEEPPGSLKMALHYDNYYGAGVKLNYTTHNLLLSNTKLVASVEISKYFQSKINYQKYYGKRKNMLVSLGSSYSYNILPLNVDEGPAGMFTNNFFTMELIIKKSVTLNSQFGAGAIFEYSDVKPEESVQFLYPETIIYNSMGYWGFGFTGYFINYTFDDVFFPRTGRNLSFGFKTIIDPQLVVEYLSDTLHNVTDPSTFIKALLEYDRYIPLSPKVSLNIGGSAGISYGDLNYTNCFYAGGYKYNLRSDYQSFVGFNIGDLSTNNLIRAKLGLNYRLFSNLEINLLSNVMIEAESYKDFEDIAKDMDMNSFILGGGVGLTYKTIFGPVSIFIADNNKEGDLYWYLNLGFPF